MARGGGEAHLLRLVDDEVRIGDDRATLTLAATERREASHIQVESYALDAIKARSNGPAPPSCQDAAQTLVERLNRRLPTLLTAAEVQRRQGIFARLERRNWLPRRYEREAPKRGRGVEGGGGWRRGCTELHRCR